MPDQIIEVIIAPLGAVGGGSGSGLSDVEDYLEYEEASQVLSIKPATETGEVAAWNNALSSYELRQLTGEEVTFTGSDYTTVEQALRSLLEVAVKINSWTVNGQNSLLLELGDEITNSISLGWSLNIDQNLLDSLSVQNPDALPLDPSGINETSSSPVAVTLTSPIGSASPGSDRLVLSVVQTLADGSSRSISKTARFYYDSRLYYGTETTSSVTDGQLLNMSSNLRRNSPNSLSFSTNGAEYLFLAWPTTWGAANSFVVGGLETSFTENVRNVVNSFGVSREYYIYRSLNQVTASSITVQIN